MKAKIIIVYDEKEQMYSANSPELERYHILSTEGYDIPDVLEHYVANIEREISMCERMLTKGDVSDMDDEDFQEDEVLKAITGLNLFVEVRCEDESDDDDAMYVNAANLMFMLQHGQKDKAGMDYYFHPMRVSMKCNLIESKTVALLHDIVEDTSMTFEKLRIAQFSEEIIDGVRAVTRKDGESYADFIARAAKNDLGHAVKINDLEDNMNITRLPNLSEKDCHRLNKYLHAWRYLTGLETTTDLIKE